MAEDSINKRYIQLCVKLTALWLYIIIHIDFAGKYLAESILPVEFLQPIPSGTVPRFKSAVKLTALIADFQVTNHHRALNQLVINFIMF